MGTCCTSSANPDRLSRNIDALSYNHLKEHSHSNITSDEKVNENSKQQKNPTLSVKSVSFKSIGNNHFAQVQLKKSTTKSEETTTKNALPHFVANGSLPSLPPLDDNEHIQILYKQTSKKQNIQTPALTNNISVEWQSYINNEHAYLLKNIPHFSAMNYPKDSILHTKHSKEQALIIQLKTWIQQFDNYIVYILMFLLFCFSHHRYGLPAVNEQTKGIQTVEVTNGEHDVTVFESEVSKNLENIPSNVSKISTTICHDEQEEVSVFSPIEISISKDIKGGNLNAEITPFQNVSNTFDYQAIFEQDEESENCKEESEASESALDDICISDENIDHVSDNTQSIHFSEHDIDLMSNHDGDNEMKQMDETLVNDEENATLNAPTKPEKKRSSMWKKKKRKKMKMKVVKKEG